MIPEFFVLVSFFYHFGWVANLIIKRASFIDSSIKTNFWDLVIKTIPVIRADQHTQLV